MQFRFLAATLLCAAPLVHAQETVDPVIVTASRVAESADETLAAVTVIDRATIERSQAQTLADLLRATPGIMLDVNGGRGKLTNLFLRGTGASHALVLVDGVKVGSATNGQVALQDIPAAQIDRIEVVRGPRSSLYGSEAIGGVIQIFTRRAHSGFHPNMSTTIGSHDTLESSIGANGAAGGAWYSVQLQSVDTAGFNTCVGCMESDDDGYTSTSSSARLGYRFDSGFEAELHGLRSHSESEFDGSYQDRTKSAIAVSGARLSYAVIPEWNASLSLAESKDYSDNYKGQLFSSRFNTVRDHASLQNDFTLGERWVTVGFDYQADRVDGTADYDVESRINRGLFAQYRTTLGRHDLQMAVRGDGNEQFGYHRTGNLAWGTAIEEGMRLTAAYGTAFKAPNFNDLYWPFGGNPHLRPETAVSTELGLQTVGPAGVDLRLFRTDVSDLIAWTCAANCADADFDNDIYLPMNVARARIDGIELALHGTFSGWATRLAVTMLDARNDATGNLLPRRARATARLDTDRQFGAYSLGATVTAEGDRFDDEQNTTELPGYATLDLRSDYLLAPAWHLGARIENAFDQDYQTAARYAQAGRSYFLTLSYRP